MFALKPLSREAIQRSIEKAAHYRLLNEPRVAESICQDILRIDPENQQALIILVLALTDQFGLRTTPGAVKQPLELAARLTGAYERAYYTGIVYERQAKARLIQSYPGAKYDAYELLVEAMGWFEKAEPLEPADSDDAVLRWNSCARIIMQHDLQPRPQDDFRPYLE